MRSQCYFLFFSLEKLPPQIRILYVYSQKHTVVPSRFELHNNNKKHGPLWKTLEQGNLNLNEEREKSTTILFHVTNLQ